MVKFLDLHAQYISIKDEIDLEIKSVISKSSFIGGQYVEDFEKSFANYQQANFCVGVGNGTDALEIAIEALDLPNGSEIIVPANSFISSAEAVTRCGHKIVFCDINRDDYTINIKDLKSRITSETSAIIAVHLYGHPCDFDSLITIAKKHNLKIIEDCAQSHGAEYKGQKVGSIADISCFSFHPVKNITTCEGGMMVTNNETYYKRGKSFRSHGISRDFMTREKDNSHYYEMNDLGFNYRIPDVLCALGISQMDKLNDFIYKRNFIADFYHEYFRKKMPMKVYQVGKSFRNEISPRQSVVRGREFTQFEAQLFLFENHKIFCLIIL